MHISYYVCKWSCRSSKRRMKSGRSKNILSDMHFLGSEPFMKINYVTI